MRCIYRLPLLFLVFCRCGTDSAVEANVETDRLSATAERAGAAVVTDVPFVAYVQETVEGGTRVVVYYPDEERSAIVATSREGGKPLRLVFLPWEWQAWGRRLRAGSPGVKLIYLDSRTGERLRPDLDGNDRRLLLDMVGDRALVLEHDPEPADKKTPRSGQLYLFRGGHAQRLGRMCTDDQISAVPRSYYWLRPDRDFLVWQERPVSREQPANVWGADLRTGEVHPWTGFKEWLPDSTGDFVRVSREPGVTWRLIDSQSGKTVAKGGGRLRSVSPCGDYWMIEHQDRHSDPPGYVQVAPRREPSGAMSYVDEHWVRKGDEVWFWYSLQPNDGTGRWFLYQISPHGYKKLVWPHRLHAHRVLTQEDGGRLALVQAISYIAEGDTEPKSFYRELVIVNFEGRKIAVTRTTTASYECLEPYGQTVFAVERTQDDKWLINRVNFMTGEVETVFRADFRVRLAKVGNSYVVAVDDRAYRRICLHVSRDGGQSWRLLAEGICEYPYSSRR